MDIRSNDNAAVLVDYFLTRKMSTRGGDSNPNIGYLKAWQSRQSLRYHGPGVMTLHTII